MEAIVGMFKKELKKRDARINDCEGKVGHLMAEFVKFIDMRMSVDTAD